MKLCYLCKNATPGFKQFLISWFCCRNIDFLWINLRYQLLNVFYELSCSPLPCLLHHSAYVLIFKQVSVNAWAGVLLYLKRCWTTINSLIHRKFCQAHANVLKLNYSRLQSIFHMKFESKMHVCTELQNKWNRITLHT
jgi:hypothetical protein